MDYELHVVSVERYFEEELYEICLGSDVLGFSEHLVCYMLRSVPFELSLRGHYGCLMRRIVEAFKVFIESQGKESREERTIEGNQCRAMSDRGILIKELEVGQ